MRTLGKMMLVFAATWFIAACGDDDNDNDNNNGNVTTFRVNLTTSEVTPRCTAAGSTATGVAQVSVSDNNQFIQVQELTFTGLSGPATSAGIFEGAVGVNGPEILALDVNLVPFSTVSFDAADFPSPVPANASADFPTFVDAMRNGDTFIVVSTAACPDGEIRAQIL